MSPEKIGANNTETSEVKSTSEVLTNEEITAENDVQKWADETHLDSENTDLGINESEENGTETLSENEKLAKELLKAPQFKELTNDERKEIYQKALELIEEYEMMGFPIALDELKKEFEKDDTRVETVSVQDEYAKRGNELTEKNTPLKEKFLTLQKEFAEKLPQSVVNVIEKTLAVVNFTETDKTITKEEKELIQTKLGSADLFSPGGFETAMYAVYADESISEETREKLIQVSGVVNVPQVSVKTPSDLSNDLKNREEARKEQFSKLKKQEKTLTPT